MLTARFVDSIASAPTVRLNTHDGSTWRLHESSRFDPPTAKRAVASTLLVDGATHSASAYEERALDLVWRVDTSTPDAAAIQVQSLARELDRESNIFQYQLPGMTHPVFFRTRRLGLQGLDIHTDGSLLTLRASIPAEPFAYGLPQTLSSATVTNNPAAGSNGMFFDVSGILGDVETPLVLRINHADTVETWGKQSVFAVRRTGTPSSTPFSLQAESMTQGTDTSTASNSAYSGGSYSACTFATTSAMATRLSTTSHPSSASVDARGRYRVYLRCRNGSSTNTTTVRLQWGDSNQLFTNNSVTLPTGNTNRRYVDLGDITIPFSADAAQLSGVARAAAGVYLGIQAERTAGSGNLDMDVLLLVPADDRLCLVGWYAFSGPTHAWLDGVNDTVYHTDASGNTAARRPSTAIGGMPTVTPGATNRIFVVGDVSTSSSTADDITDTMTIVPSYLPRYLYVRPAST